MVKLKHSFPDSFFEEEDRLGFHIDRKRKEIWAVELDMLYELDRVCKKLNVQYFLDGGTLLGAVRDGHIIPWDDDIDVSMLREDYDRFLREAPKEFEYPHFLQCAYTDPGYFRGHAQLRNSATAGILPNELDLVPFNQGIFLDIFVLDELFPDLVEKQYRERDRLWRQRRVCTDRSYRGSPLRWIAKQLRYWQYQTHLGKFEKFYARLEAVFRSNKKSEYVDYLLFNRGMEDLHFLKRNWYEGVCQIDFEGQPFPVPQGYREYLELYYGKNWGTPKNIPSLHTVAGNVIIDVNRPYTEVLRDAGFQIPK